MIPFLFTSTEYVSALASSVQLGQKCFVLSRSSSSSVVNVDISLTPGVTVDVAVQPAFSKAVVDFKKRFYSVESHLM